MNKPVAILVDGKPLPQGQGEWPLDRGLQYGDGLFETMIVRAGHIRFEALHRQRLATGCERLRLTIPQAPLWEQAAALARPHGAAVLKLLVTRGTALQRGYEIGGSSDCRSILYVYAAPDSVDDPAVSIVSLNARLGENAALAGIKHCNRLEQVLARMELQATGAFEGLMSSSSGLLISGTMSNVFLDTEAGLVTPALNHCGVEGVLRAVVLRETAAMGLPVRVSDVPLTAMNDCRGLFLTNVRFGVLPANRLNGRALAVSSQVRALAQRVAALAD